MVDQFRNTDQVGSTSGVAKSGSWLNVQLAGPTRTTKVGGTAVISIDPPVILNSVLPYIVSGGIITVFSGQRMQVSNATSGMYAKASGDYIYYHDFGKHSGTIIDAEFIPGQFGPIPPPPIYPNLMCGSGITASASGAHFELIINYTPIEVAP